MSLRLTACLISIAVLLGACGEGGGASPRGPSPDSSAEDSAHDHGGDGREAVNAAAECRPSGTALSLAAKNIKFDKECLAAPADQAFSIEFNNEEAVPHNVAILADHDAEDALFKGETFSGPGTRTYQVTPLKAGKYHFHCDVHPEMQGDFTVA